MSTQSTTPQQGSDVTIITEPEAVWRPTQEIKTQSVKPRPDKPLTRKQQAFVKHLVDNPKASATQAVRATYNVKQEGSTARTVASELLAKPSIQTELAKYSSKAENVLVEVLEQSKRG
jgi:hypothetical protein